MRTSVIKDDPGFENFKFEYGKWNIFLNGRLMDKVITADEEEGFVLRFALDSNGKYIWNQTRTDLVKDKLYGKVEILEFDQAIKRYGVGSRPSEAQIESHLEHYGNSR